MAWGGTGKTALVAEWYNRNAKNWNNQEWYFDWSFSHQGTQDSIEASAASFIEAALTHFKDPNPERGSPEDKGDRLAGLVAARRTLLILDGLEPLQFSPGGQSGHVRDPALRTLLKGLAQRPNQGLCLITTRIQVADLDPFHESKTVKPMKLPQLSPRAGAELLFEAGAIRAGEEQISNKHSELKIASLEVEGHALTLQLLGRFLQKARGGDILARKNIQYLEADRYIEGGYAYRVIEAYEGFFNNNPDEGQLQLAVLRLLGLFNRKADGHCLERLREAPPIQGLTDTVTVLDRDRWNIILSDLEDLGLISTSRSNHQVSTDPLAIDAHPIVREYFASQLRERWPQAWKAAHHRLYHHLIRVGHRQPETLDEMQPLYQAILHGCYAGLQQVAYEDVYKTRILRNRQRFSSLRLGAFTANLEALAGFFDKQWTQPSKNLTSAASANLLNEVAFHLLVLGRPNEALQPALLAVESATQNGDWKAVPRYTDNVINSYLTLGLLDETIRNCKASISAVERFHEAIRHSHLEISDDDQNECIIWRMASNCALANALHQAGELQGAEVKFREAEAILQKSHFPLEQLIGLASFQYCEYLLRVPERLAWNIVMGNVASETEMQVVESLSIQRGICEQVSRRAERSLKHDTEREHSHLHPALDHLTLTRSNFYAAIISRQKHDEAAIKRHISKADKHIRLSMEEFLRANQEFMMPLSLLTHAWLLHYQGREESARTVLKRATQIAERGSMKLFMADIRLTEARLSRDRPTLNDARTMITEINYKRRQNELDDAEMASSQWIDS